MTPEESAVLQQVGDVFLQNVGRPLIGCMVFGASILLTTYAFLLIYESGMRGFPARIIVASAIFCFSAQMISTGGEIASLAVNYRAFSDPANYAINNMQQVVASVNEQLKHAYGLTTFLEFSCLTTSGALVIWRTQALYPETRFPAIGLGTIMGLSFVCFFSGETMVYLQPPTSYCSLACEVGYGLIDVGHSLSLISNTVTTIMVGYKLWSHRRYFLRHLDESSSGWTPTQKKILLLVETGFAFCVLQASTVFLSGATFVTHLGPLLVLVLRLNSRVLFGFAANHTIILFILVKTKSSVTDTLCAFADSGVYLDDGPQELTNFNGNVTLRSNLS